MPSNHIKIDTLVKLFHKKPELIHMHLKLLFIQHFISLTIMHASFRNRVL